MKEWFIAAGIRAIKTAAQAALGVVGAGVYMNDIQWLLAGSSALLAAIVSLLTSAGGIPEANDGESLFGTITASSDGGEADGSTEA